MVLQADGPLHHCCFWPQADVTWERRGVRFQVESGHDADWLSLPSLTHNGLGGSAHSMTSWALASREGWRVMPRDRAVAALITSSNLVGSSTGS
jgi:hypothetical protein